MGNLIENAIDIIDTGAINISLSNPIPEYLLSKGFEINNDINEKSYLMFDITAKGLDPSQYGNIDIFDFELTDEDMKNLFRFNEDRQYLPESKSCPGL